MKKKLFKAMLPTISLLLVAVMSLTGVTYAWFTSGKTAQVEAFDVKVKAVDGILLSLTGFNGTWGSYVDPLTDTTAIAWDDANHSHATKVVSDDYKTMLAKSLVDVSGVWNATSNTMDFYSAVFDENSKTISSTAKVVAGLNPADNQNYYVVALDLFIKNDGTVAKTIYLDGSSITGSAMTRAATRVAFVNQGTASSTAVLHDETAPVTGGQPALIGIWEPNETIHTPDGENGIAAYNKAMGTTLNSDVQIPYKAVNVATTADGFYDMYTGLGYVAAATPALTVTDKDYTLTGATGLYVIGDGFKSLTLDDYFTTATYQEVLNIAGDYFTKGTDNYTKFTGTPEQNVIYYKRVADGKPACYSIGTTNILTAQPVTVKTDVTDTNGKNTNGLTFEVPATTIEKITIYIWVEGQDVDTTNYVSGNKFSVDLRFTTVRE